MKKWLAIEAVILALLLVAAVVVCISISQSPAVPADTDLDETLQTTEQTAEQTTEPEPTWMTFPADRTLTAQQAFVYDCQSESFTYLLGAKTDKVYPASVTKLFTAYVALQYLQPETLVTAGDVLDLVGAGSSVAQIEKGNVLSVETLVEAMLLPSGNDAAYLLAAEAGWKIAENTEISGYQAVQKFVAQMNIQAQALGMNGTHFTNPDGYHSTEHYSCIQDLAVIGMLALENETILKYAAVSSDDVTIESGESFQWSNTNSLVDPVSEYFCPYAVGLKTGQTPSAGSCLLSAFDVDGQQYVIGVFGCPEIEDRFEDTLQLFNEALGITK